MQQFRPQRFQILPTIVKNLLIINGLMYLATVVLQENFKIDLTDYLALHYFTSPYFKPHQILTHMFMHGSVAHIFSNMFALWMFGSTIENYWGPKRFLFFYLVCGLGGAAAHLGVTAYHISMLQNDVNVFMIHATPQEFLNLFHTHLDIIGSDSYLNEVNKTYANLYTDPNNTANIFHAKEIAMQLPLQIANIPVLGASGAVFGVLLAFGMMFPNMELYLYFLFPIKAKYFVAMYMLFELYAGFSGAQDGVAHFAHIGGAVIGFILIKYWNRTRRQDFFLSPSLTLTKGKGNKKTLNFKP